MSNVDELPDLAGDVRDRAVPPPYEQVTRRVRDRRLRIATGTMAAAVVAVGGIAIWQNAATTAAPSPAPPISQPPDPAYPASPAWRQVVDGTDAHPFEAEGTDDGSIAVVWRALEHPEPTFALVIREADGTVHGRRLDSPVSLTPVPGGWVGVRTTQGFFIASDGTWTSLGTPQQGRTPRAGDVFVRGQFASWLYSPDERSLSTMPDGEYDGYVTPDGDLMACEDSGGAHVLVSYRDRRSPSVVGFSCVMAGRGSTVVAAGLGDDPDGGIPLTGLLLGDVDNSWSVPRFQYTAVDDVASLVVTPGLRALVTDTDGDAVLFGRDGSSAEVSTKLGVAFVAGDRIYATSYALGKGPLLYSDDDGVTWQETTLPGIESSEE